MSQSELTIGTHTGLERSVPGKPGILLIEDERIAEDVVEHIVKYGDFEVYHAKTVQQALSLAMQYPTLRFIAVDMGLPYDDPSGTPDREAGIVLLRELS